MSWALKIQWGPEQVGREGGVKGEWLSGGHLGQRIGPTRVYRSSSITTARQRDKASSGHKRLESRPRQGWEGLVG